MSRTMHKPIAIFMVFVLTLSLWLPSSSPAQAVTSNDLGPVTSKDVIYQIITDRFYDGDISNNIPVGFDPQLFDGTGQNLAIY